MLVDEIMQNPDDIIISDECKHIYQKSITLKDKNYLYRLFVNVCKKPAIIITGYRTSKIEKYEN